MRERISLELEKLQFLDKTFDQVNKLNNIIKKNKKNIRKGVS